MSVLTISTVAVCARSAAHAPITEDVERRPAAKSKTLRRLIAPERLA